MGHMNVYIVPVHQLRALDGAAVKIPIGGSHITEQIMKTLNFTAAEREIARQIKEKHGMYLTSKLFEWPSFVTFHFANSIR